MVQSGNIGEANNTLILTYTVQLQSICCFLYLYPYKSSYSNREIFYVVLEHTVF